MLCALALLTRIYGQCISEHYPPPRRWNSSLRAEYRQRGYKCAVPLRRPHFPLSEAAFELKDAAFLRDTCLTEDSDLTPDLVNTYPVGKALSQSSHVSTSFPAMETREMKNTEAIRSTSPMCQASR